MDRFSRVITETQWEFLRALGVVVAAILALMLVLWVALWPGRIAHKRNHPAVEAIRFCGLVGILLWPSWIVAMAWALSVPPPKPEWAKRLGVDNP